MLLSLRKNGLTSLFKEVTGFSRKILCVSNVSARGGGGGGCFYAVPATWTGPQSQAKSLAKKENSLDLGPGSRDLPGSMLHFHHYHWRQNKISYCKLQSARQLLHKTAQRAQRSKNISRFRSRLKISIENEIFERATHRGPIFCGEIETSRLKISSEIENFDRD